jgi:ribonuclease HII
MPTVEHEWRLIDAGYHSIAGIDEVGRGCWAGPVVAAAVILHRSVLEDPALLTGIDDSKRLTADQRTALLPRIARAAAGIGIGAVPAFLVDSFGIVAATRLAMELAVLSLPKLPDALLIDALRLPALPIPQVPLIRGDSLSYSIAAASIVAKSARDRRMATLERDAVRYGFAQHKGYGTAAHQEALRRLGPGPEHRRSFRPLWNEERYDTRS